MRPTRSPTTRSIAQVDFVRPVEVGALLALEEPRRPRLRPGPRLRRRHGRRVEAGPPRVDADEQLLVRFRRVQGAAAAQNVLTVVRTEAAMQLDAA